MSENSGKTFVLVDKNWQNDMVKSLQEMQKLDQFCDVVLQLDDGVQLSCHSCIIAANIPSMKVKLVVEDDNSSGKGLIILLSGVTENIMKYIVQFCYGGYVEVPCDELATLQKAAKLLDFTTLVELCDFMLPNGEPPLKTENVDDDEVVSLTVTGIEHVDNNEDFNNESYKKELEKENNEQRLKFLRSIDTDGLEEEDMDDSISAGKPYRNATDKALHSIVKEEILEEVEHSYALQSQDNYEETVGDTVNEESGFGNEESVPEEVDSDSETDDYDQHDDYNKDPLFTVNDSNKEDSQCTEVNTRSKKSNMYTSKPKNSGVMTAVILRKITSGKSKVDGKKQVNTKDKGKYICRICGEALDKLKPFAEHMNMHKGLKPYKCQNCDKSYAVENALKAHMKVHIGEEYPCDICGRLFAYKKTMLRHRKAHPPGFVPKYFGPKPAENRCEICDKVFKSFPLLMDHKNVHEGLKPYKCEHCEKCFAQEAYLKYHMRMHSGVEYPCDKCGKVYALKRSMLRHRMKHPENFVPRPKINKCELCNKVYKNWHNLQYHMNRHKGVKPYKCDQCDKAYYSADSLRVHKEDHRGRSYACNMCDKQFLTRKKLVRHKLHHGERVFAKFNCSPTLECPECKRMFYTQINLNRHIKVDHGNKDEHQFICYSCGKVLKNKHNLELHVAACTGNCKFHCDFCEKPFVTKEGLFKHLSWNHMPEVEQNEKYKKSVILCSFCGKSFLAKSLLRDHEILHKDERHFRCIECDKAFNNREALNSHRSNVHMRQPKQFKCTAPICTKAFKTLKSLKRHQKKHKEVYEYECQYCGKGYNDQDRMESHYNYCKLAKGKHPRPKRVNNKKFECDVCGVVTTTMGSLKRHKVKHTGTYQWHCQFCGKGFRRKDEMNKHAKNCKASTNPTLKTEFHSSTSLDNTMKSESNNKAKNLPDESGVSSDYTNQISSLNVEQIQGIPSLNPITVPMLPPNWGAHGHETMYQPNLHNYNI